MYMPSHRYPGNADVPVGMLVAPCAIVRNPADEDVGVPRLQIVLSRKTPNRGVICSQ